MEKKPLKNFGMITESEFVGKTLQEAQKKAENDGFTTRITEKDGDSFILSMDYRSDRINFRILRDVVIAAYGG